MSSYHGFDRALVGGAMTGAKWVTAGAGGVLHPHVPREVDDHFSFSQMKQWRAQSDLVAYRRREHTQTLQSQSVIQTLKFCMLHHTTLALLDTMSWSHPKFLLASYRTFLSTSKNFFYISRCLFCKHLQTINTSKMEFTQNRKAF